MKNKLKELAKTLFFKQVLNDFYRNSFLQKIETHEVQDKREDGFYCSYCRGFLFWISSQAEGTSPQEGE